MTRAETDRTLRFGQRLTMGASEWRLESAFADDARTLRAGYGYRLGDALSRVWRRAGASPLTMTRPITGSC